jgi:hypothetical protein
MKLMGSIFEPFDRHITGEIELAQRLQRSARGVNAMALSLDIKKRRQAAALQSSARAHAKLNAIPLTLPYCTELYIGLR